MFEKGGGDWSESLRLRVPRLFPSPFGEMFEKGQLPFIYLSNSLKTFPSPFGEMFEKDSSSTTVSPFIYSFPSPFGEMFEKDSKFFVHPIRKVLFPSPFGEMFEKATKEIFDLHREYYLFPSPFGEMFEKDREMVGVENEPSSFHPLSGKCLKKSTGVVECFANHIEFGFHPLSGKCLKKLNKSPAS